MKKEHFEILLEDIDGKFDLVLEGFQGLRNDMGRMEERLNAKIDLNSDKIDILNGKIDHNTARIDAVDKKLSNRIDAVDKKLSNRIDAVDKKLSNRIDKLSDRVTSVEENLGPRIDAVAVDLKAHRADTEIHHGVYRVREMTKD